MTLYPAIDPQEEKTGFLSPPNARKPPPARTRRKWTKKKICLLSCLCCALIVLSVIGGGLIYVFALGSEYSGNSAHWDTILNASFYDTQEVRLSGVYELVSFDDQYDDYLKAMGIPFYIVPLIVKGSESITVELNDTDVDKASIKLTTITDWMTRESLFKLNEEFSMKYGKGNMGGFMHNTCQRPRPNIIHCKSEEREKKWNFESELIFSPAGMVNKRTFVNKEIVTHKFYHREGYPLDAKIIRKRDDKDVSQEDEVDTSFLFEEDEDDWFETDDI